MSCTSAISALATPGAAAGRPSSSAPSRGRPRCVPAAGRTRPPGRRPSVKARVGRSGTNRFTGESEWVEVSDAAAAIERGQAMYEAKEYDAAIAEWEGALKLGGSGTKRDRAKPAELSLGEKQAAFYNLMCAHSMTGDLDRSVQALEAALRAGYCSAELYGFGKANEDYARLMRDPDLAAVRGDARFAQVIGQYKVEPTELQLQLDPSQSVIGRAMKMWGSKK